MNEGAQKLTPAQAKWVKERAREIFGNIEVYPDTRAGAFGVAHSAYTQALDELTAKPPDREFCGMPKPCEWWGVEVERWEEDCGVWGERLIEYEDKTFCGHDDFDGEKCPTDRWGEKGGEAE